VTNTELNKHAAEMRARRKAPNPQRASGCFSGTQSEGTLRDYISKHPGVLIEDAGMEIGSPTVVWYRMSDGAVLVGQPKAALQQQSSRVTNAA